MSTKLQKLLEITSHLKDDCAFLAQKVGFVHQNDRFILSVCRTVYRVMKKSEDRPLAYSLVRKQHTHQKRLLSTDSFQVSPKKQIEVCLKIHRNHRGVVYSLWRQFIRTGQHLYKISLLNSEVWGKCVLGQKPGFLWTQHLQCCSEKVLLIHSAQP